MGQRGSTELLLAASLAASTCLLAAACSGPVAGRPGGAGGEGPATATPSRDRKEELPRLYRVWLKGKIGFSDRAGRLVIPAKFEGGYRGEATRSSAAPRTHL